MRKWADARSCFILAFAALACRGPLIGLEEDTSTDTGSTESSTGTSDVSIDELGRAWLVASVKTIRTGELRSWIALLDV